MKLTSHVIFASAATALVLPQSNNAETDPNSSWLDKLLPSLDFIDYSVDYVSSGIESIVDVAEGLHDKFRHQLASVADHLDALDTVDTADRHDFSNLTIYQLIKLSNSTTKFASLVDSHPDVVKLLNSTDAGNHTLFVPIDAAFEHIPKGKKPGDEFIESLLRYHVADGDYPARKLLGVNTIPTALKESFLGGESQRLRISLSLSGININLYNKIVVGDIKARNGFIHAVRYIIVPPPMIGRILTLLPDKFSTLLLAYEKTDFVSLIHGMKMLGSTVFAPSNKAFTSLGPSANAFLFNTEKGLGYLKALLKYHIAPNATLYSDTFYDKTSVGEVEGLKREHFDLGTLLGSAEIDVEVITLAGFTGMRANGLAKISPRDVPGKNGVIQVIDKVLLPPCKNKEEIEMAAEIGIEELMECMDAFMDEAPTPPHDSLEL